MRRILQCAAIGLVVIAQLWGCSDEGGTPFNNQSPTVWLSSAPPEGSLSRYTVHLYWGGWDPDGEIQFYEYVVTNNTTGVFNPADTTSHPGDYKWNRVYGNDSTFTFSADLIPDSSAVDFEGTHGPEEFRRSHTFFIRAVDEQGMRSSKPAYRSFTSRTLSPTVYVDVPIASGLNAAEVPSITTFRWTSKDYVTSEAEVQLPDSVRHLLVSIKQHNNSWDETLNYIRKNPKAKEWSRWKYYSAPGDSGRFWTSPNLDSPGAYVFAVQAKDEAGAVSPVFDLDWNVRRISVGPRSTGPLLTVINQFIGTARTSIAGGSPVIVDLPAGVAMSFEFEATAESYGGIVSGYRYGWDILDLSDPDQWSTDYTPFIPPDARAKAPPRTFFFGTHTFFIEVIDNSGFKSRLEVRLNVVPFTMENDLLLVDDWSEGLTGFAKNNGTTPSAAEHDAFWIDVLSSAAGFNPNTDIFKLRVAGKNELPIQVMAKYKNLIWYASGNNAGVSGAFLDQVIDFRDPDAPVGGKTTPNLVALYMAAGGHVVLTGDQIMTMVINPNTFGQGAVIYPIIFRYELAGDQDGTYGPPDNDIGRYGVGDKSFAYFDCCLNVLDITYVQNANQQRHSGPEQRCPVNFFRERNRVNDGLRRGLPLDLTSGPGFPQLDFRPEVSNPGKFYSTIGLIADIYNPDYFGAPGMPCASAAETNPLRDCFQPIYGNGCANTSSVIYNAPVAFWTSQFADRLADVSGAVRARSAIFGFHLVYFQPDQVRDALGVILHDEWQLQRK